MIKKLSKLIVPVILVVLGSQFVMNHFRLNSQISNLELLVSEGSKIETVLNKEYKEVTIKIAKLPVKYYEFEYSFNYKGKQYNGNESFSSIPNTLRAEVTFLPENPTINNINPIKDLNELKEDKGSFINLIIGSLMMLVGGFLLYSRIKNIPAKNNFDNQRSEFYNNEPKSKISEKKKFKKQKIEPAIIKEEKFQTKSENSFINEMRAKRNKHVTEGVKLNQEFKNEMKLRRERDFGVTDHSKYLPKSTLLLSDLKQNKFEEE